MLSGSRLGTNPWHGVATATLWALAWVAGCKSSPAPAGGVVAVAGAPTSEVGDGGAAMQQGEAGTPTGTDATNATGGAADSVGGAAESPGGAAGEGQTATGAAGDGTGPVNCPLPATSAEADWKTLNQGLPDAVEVITLAHYGCALYAGTVDHGLFRFDDTTETWASAFDTHPPPTVSSMLAIDDTALIGTDAGLFRSQDGGKVWSPTTASFFAISLLADGAKIFAGANLGGIHVSNDGGVHWEPASTGLPSATTGVYSLAMSGARIFAGTDKGVFVSDNDGDSWTASSKGIDDTYSTNLVILSMGRFGPNLLAGTLHRLLVSDNDGMSWSEAKTDVKGVYDGYGFVQAGARIFAATGNVVLPSRVLVSEDKGASWAPLGTLTAKTVRSITTHGGQLFAGTAGAGVWRISL